ncbi:hypothetical protein CYMTET_47560 [Cymbomonas tetramitiformis]|uniref:Tyrosine-protein kinase ephrin type A/B receptor-like domain-containing protein n=1 Tax=Cymbomonas tetramitiformis TaxID=36881 RepID=A0AAE0BVW9_9CHLO|nr:hypothetical protein CYMTET_47560 [Cymbomonas tetramitiformis]
MKNTEEEDLPILVSDSRGIVFYVPPKDIASSGTPLASFKYAWKFKSGVESVQAICNIWVQPVNDAPIPISQTIVVEPYDESIQITLQQTDVDPTFATRPYFRVSTWPELGSMLQGNGDFMEEKEGVPIILQYIEDVPPFHKPTNTPAFSSQYSLCGSCCYTQENCTMLEAECGVDCVKLDWHATNMVGPPDNYPTTADSVLGWDFICNFCSEKQYGVFQYADPVYINSATLFENNAGGSIYKISASSTYEGSDTEWTTLWEGEPGPLPENVARAFSPPLCQEVQEKFQYVRLDFDPAAVPGWNNHDAMALRGSFEFPPGQVSSPSGAIMYAPAHGVHSSDGSTPVVEFTYLASDCVDEGKEGASVKLAVGVPEPGTGSLFAAARQTSNFLIDDKVTVDLGVEAVVEALSSSIGTDYYAARLDEVQVQLMASSNGESGEYRVKIENTDRSLDSITLHMWITFPSKFITFRIEIYLAAACHESITDPTECASTELDCLRLGSNFLPDMKRCFRSCDPGYEPTLVSQEENSTEPVACTPCPAGMFSDGRGVACVPCTPGFVSFEEGSPTCEKCRPGEYMDESGGTQCKLCNPGFFQGDRGQAECIPCAPGFSNPAPGGAACSLCASKTYANASGTVECDVCPPNTNNFQAINLESPEGTVEATSSSTNGSGVQYRFIPNSLLHCKPLPGYYGQPGAEAKVCPEGGVCCHCQPGSFDTFGDGLAKLGDIDGFNYNEYCTCMSGTMPFPYPTKGFMRSDEEGYEDKMVECSNADACSGSLAVSAIDEVKLVMDEESRADMLEDVSRSRTYPWASGHCSRGYTGRLCMECDDEFFSTNGLCLRCPDGFGAKLGFTLSAFVAIVAAWVFLGVTMAGTYQSLSILLLYLQIGSMLQGFGMEWPDAVNQWALVQTIVNFDVDLITPQCVIENYGFEWSYYLQLILPLIVLAVNWLTYGVVAYKIRHASATMAVKARKLEQLRDTKISTVTSFTEVVYHSLCIRCFQAWMCDSMGDDLQYLVAAPYIECWEGPHIVMVVVSILALFVYVIGIPVVFAAVLHYGYKNDLLVAESFASKFGWMYGAYELQWYWWILMIFVRRLVCAALLVFLASDPFLQATLALFLILASTVAHFFARPFVETQIDVMESTALLNLCFLIISGMVFYTKKDDENIEWIVSFFAVLGAQMSLGVGIFAYEVYTAHVDKKAIQGMQNKLETVTIAYNKRHFTYSLAIMGMGKKQKHVTSKEFAELLQNVDDSLPEGLRPMQANKLFRLGQSVQGVKLGNETTPDESQNGSNGAKKPSDDDDFEEVFEVTVAATPLPGVNTVAIDVLLQAVAIDFLDITILQGMRELSALILYVDKDGNSTLSKEEVMPLWGRCMPPELEKNLYESVLECFFLLAGEDGELSYEEIQHSLDSYNKGRTNILKMLEKLDRVSVDRIQLTLDELVAMLSKSEKKRDDSKVGNAALSRSKSMFNAAGNAIGAIGALSKSIITDNTPIGQLLMQGDDAVDLKDDLMSQCEKMLSILNTGVLQAFIKEEQEDGNFIIFFELAKIVRDMSRSSDPQIQIHGTSNESCFYNTFFDTFPFILHWMLEADMEQQKAALKFLESLCEFQKKHEDEEVTCESMFKESFTAQIGYIWLKRYVEAEGMYARYICQRMLSFWTKNQPKYPVQFYSSKFSQPVEANTGSTKTAWAK